MVPTDWKNMYTSTVEMKTMNSSAAWLLGWCLVGEGHCWCSTTVQLMVHCESMTKINIGQRLKRARAAVVERKQACNNYTWYIKYEHQVIPIW